MKLEKKRERDKNERIMHFFSYQISLSAEWMKHRVPLILAALYGRTCPDDLIGRFCPKKKISENFLNQFYLFRNFGYKNLWES